MRECTLLGHSTHMVVKGQLSGLRALFLPGDPGIGFGLSSLWGKHFDLLSHFIGPQGNSNRLKHYHGDPKVTLSFCHTARTSRHSQCEQEPDTHKTVPVHDACCLGTNLSVVGLALAF